MAQHPPGHAVGLRSLLGSRRTKDNTAREDDLRQHAEAGEEMPPNRHTWQGTAREVHHLKEFGGGIMTGVSVRLLCLRTEVAK